MIEIQCTSCQTRYRIDERILPEDTPTFKCSRCGHVFSAEPRQKAPRRASAESARSVAAAKSVSSSAAAGDTPPPAPPPVAGRAADASAPVAAPAEPEPAPPPRPQPEAPPAAFAAAEPPPAPPPPVRPRQAGAAGRGAAAQAPREDPAAIRHDPAYDTRELLQRRFGDILADEADKPGENLAFDFNDEPMSSDSASRDSALHRYPEEKWEVGDTDLPPVPPPRPKQRIRVSDIDDDLGGDAGLDQSFGRYQVRDQALDREDEEDFERIRPEEVSAQAHRLEAELRGRSYKLHSAGYFIGLFAMVVFGFGIVTMVIQSAPIASAGLLSALPIVGEGLEPPVSPARRVALGEVQAQYVTLKGNQPALIISGRAENLTSGPLGALQIEAALTASGVEPLRSQAVYCGNSLTSKMLGEMTPREIEFFEKLDAPKGFTLLPQASAPFVIVFIAPPAGAAHFQLRIVRADPVAPPAPVASSEGG